MLMCIFGVYHIFRRNAQEGTGLRLDIDLPIFFKAINKAINKSVNAKKMQSKQEKEGKRYALEAFLVCGFNLLHL